MKVRTGFVSNSSSSSFCIVGVCIDDNFSIDKAKAKEKLLFAGMNKDSVSCMENDVELIGALYEWDWSGNEPLQVMDGIDEYYDQLLIGMSIKAMKDDMTLGQFKEEVYRHLKKLGFTGELNDIGILIDGGYEG